MKAAAIVLVASLGMSATVFAVAAGITLLGAVNGILAVAAVMVAIGYVLQFRARRNVITTIYLPAIVLFAGIAVFLQIDGVRSSVVSDASNSRGRVLATIIVRLPLFLSGAFYPAVLALMVSAEQEGENYIVRSYARQASRLLLLIVAASIAIIASSASVIIRSTGATWSGTHAVVVAETLNGTLLALVITVLSVAMAERSKTLACGGVILLSLHAVLSIGLRHCGGASAAAYAGVISSGLTLVIAATLIHLRFRSLPRPLTVGNIVFAAILAYCLGAAFPMAGQRLPILIGLQCMMYVASLTALGELGRQDWEIFKRLCKPAHAGGGRLFWGSDHRMLGKRL
jgi:hypothetical protein